MILVAGYYVTLLNDLGSFSLSLRAASRQFSPSLQSLTATSRKIIERGYTHIEESLDARGMLGRLWSC